MRLLVLLIMTVLLASNTARAELGYFGSNEAHQKTWEVNAGVMSYYDQYIGHELACYAQVPIVDYDKWQINLGVYTVPADFSRTRTLFSASTTLRKLGQDLPDWISGEFGVTFFIGSGYLKETPFRHIQLQVGLIRYQF